MIESFWSRMQVELLGLVGAERDWYLVGRCRLRGAVRVVGLDRITTVEVTGEPSPEHPPPTVKDGCLPERSWHPAIVADHLRANPGVSGPARPPRPPRPRPPWHRRDATPGEAVPAPGGSGCPEQVQV